MSTDRFFTSGAADARGRQFRWPVDGLAFGGDYSPEQWSEATWLEDVALMRAAGVTIVSLGIFSWGQLETADEVYDFGWLDRIMDLLHENGISVNLATPTAAPPMWLFQKHPEIGSVDDRGVRTSAGGRLGWSASSTVFRAYALRIVRVIAERYAGHPALRMWHISNELGNENGYCYSDETEAAFRRWLRARYSSIDALNDGWGTAFWGHHFGDFDEVPVPRFARTSQNPGLLLDFKRFSSDALLEHFIAERDVVRAITPDTPLSTNFMIHAGGGAIDYARWADEVDLVTNDHYAIAADPQRREELAFSADRTRGAARGRPWLLLEHAPGSVNWQSRNRAKLPGELARDSLTHVAAGSDGAMFFQWRQSVAGGEQFHSGMVPHAGANSRVHSEVRELGAAIGRLAEVQGSTVTGSAAAILWDQDASWAFRSGRKPSEAIDYDEVAVAVHAELTARGIGVDVISASMPLAAYTLVVVANHYLLEPAAIAALREFVEAGGHVLVTYLSGIVDTNNKVIPGGYPGALRDLLGIKVEEFLPLLAGEETTLYSGAVATDWTEHVHLAGAVALDSYASGPLVGLPAVTVNRLGAGTASYLSAHLDRVSIGAVIEALLERTATPFRSPDGVETTRRSGETANWLFTFNHGDADRAVDAVGFDLLADAPFGGTLAAGQVAVIRQGTPVVPE
ncbi:MAG TPA: beta-galactosidase [Galbitalea sp.]